MRKALPLVVCAPFAVMLLFVGLLGAGQDCDELSPGQGSALSGAADESIPPKIARIYVTIARRWDLDVAFLASIGAQETGHGTHPTTYAVNGSGCQGLMQLGTGGACGDYWGRNKCDGNNDGRMNIVDDWDNICAAAKGLRTEKKAPPAGGSEADYYQAACNYYGACSDANANYAAEVMARAKRYGFGSRKNSALQTADADGPVLNLGDSLAVGSGPPLERLREGAGGVRTVAAENRTSSQGLAALRKIDTVPKRIVVQLGTNDTDVERFRRNIASVMAIARRADDAEVLWVSISRKPLGGTTDDELNAVLDGATSRYPNLTLIDWKATIRREKIKLSDGVHPSGDGYQARAEMINTALGSTTDTTVAEPGPCAPTADSELGKDEGGYTVAPGANRPGTDMTADMRAVLSAMGKLLPRPPVVGTGTAHSQFTSSGNPSDHYYGNGADIPSSLNGFPASGGGYGDTIATAALLVAGVPPQRAAQIGKSGTGVLPGGTWEGVSSGLRFQIIWKSTTGGDHFNHVHVGVKRVSGGDK